MEWHEMTILFRSTESCSTIFYWYQSTINWHHNNQNAIEIMRWYDTPNIDRTFYGIHQQKIKSLDKTRWGENVLGLGTGLGWLGFGWYWCYLSVPIIFRPSRRQTIKFLSSISTNEERTACNKKASVTAMIEDWWRGVTNGIERNLFISHCCGLKLSLSRVVLIPVCVCFCQQPHHVCHEYRIKSTQHNHSDPFFFLFFAHSTSMCHVSSPPISSQNASLVS